jgi:undecaprenyl pyrophosphate synthase
MDRQLGAYPVPRHIGLILDGNRRYSHKTRVIDPLDVYMAGATSSMN